MRRLRRGLSGIGIGSRLIELRLRSEAAFVQLALKRGVAGGVLRLRVVARERGFGLRDLRLVALDGGFRLSQCVFVRPRIDAEKQLALRYVLAFGEVRRVSSPAICDLTCTMAEASTVPTTRSSVGTACSTAFVAETGTTGGPAAACAGGASFLQAHNASKERAMQETRIARNVIPRFF